jgi:hypothetical protein
MTPSGLLIVILIKRFLGATLAVQWITKQGHADAHSMPLHTFRIFLGIHLPLLVVFFGRIPL